MTVPRPLFATNPAAGVAYYGTLIGWVAAELRQAGQTRAEATVEDRGSRQAIRFRHWRRLAWRRRR